MAKGSELFNIEPLVLTKDNTKLMREVKSPLIFETSSRVFKTDGLFSTEIFGPIGSTQRNETYGYIDLGVPVMHPFIYENLLTLSSKYEEIVSGKKYAKFNTQLGDFELTTDGSGDTGYHFFITNAHKIKFVDNNSDQRRYKINLIKKYIDPKFMSTKWLVLPAGLRDYTEDENGVPSEDEINNLYRKLLSACNMVKNTNVGNNLDLIDPVRLKIQNITDEIFQYIYHLLKGKSKFIEGKFAKRATTYGTRNILTPIPSRIKDLNDVDRITNNDTVVGLYQYVKAIAPIAMNRVQTIFINKILNPNSNQAYLINPKTMTTELVNIPVKKRDEWLSIEGLNNIMNKLQQASLRNDPVMIDKHYLAAVHDDGVNVTVYIDTGEIEDEEIKKNLRPLTYAELWYITVYDIRRKYPAFVTRYPVIDQGGIYPCNVYLKTTVEGRRVNFKFGVDSKTMVEYPILGKMYIESMSVNTNTLKRLGADFDGDMLSFVVLYTDESIKEIDNFLNSKTAYVTPTGELVNSNADDNLDIVLDVLTE